jgi:hydrogenase expression/formation protein HypD
MNLTEVFRNKEYADILLQNIRKKSLKPIRIMEVCGSHTVAIRKYGIHNLLPKNIELLSGPGCPVCVTDQKYIDTLIAFSRRHDIIILTYGDLIRVPGTFVTLEGEKATGADIRIINSTIQALEIARANPQKKIVFAAIGFETTAPATAIALIQAKKEMLHNFFILSAHKLMPPAMHFLMKEGIEIDGYIGPGHVCTITGSRIFNPLSDRYLVPVVISGFEPVDILQSILILTDMINEKRPKVEIQYKRLVTEMGNVKAQKIVEEVFEPVSENWRGLGQIAASGLGLRKNYRGFDALAAFPVYVKSGPEPKGCLCGMILKGMKKPMDCPLFAIDCKPSNPVGACMVSSEGTCNTWFNYRSI